MPTNLAIDDRLIEEARRIGRHRTKKETVTAALEEYIRQSYNYKQERRSVREAPRNVARVPG